MAIRTSRLGCGKFKARSSPASTNVKIAEVAPIPKASVTSAISVMPGVFSSSRNP